MKKLNKVSSILLCFLIMMLFTSCKFSEASGATNNVQTSTSGNLKVHFVDVGQADAILIQDPSGHSMLIDAGNNEDSDLVVNYIKAQGISKLDYVVGTHGHEDHIGGLDVVIDTFRIGNVILPKATSTTKTYKDVLLSIKNKGLKITPGVAGKSFNLGSANCEIVAPNSSDYEDLNNYSVVIKLTYGNSSFLFTGDAEDVSEHEILSKGYNLKADLLKVGHHGSDSSTSTEFLKAVAPKYAVISVGTGNKYGHPTQETLSKLNNAAVQVYRTDEVGTIIATSDGNNITIDKNKSSIKTNAPPTSNSDNQNTVYITKTGKKYHTDGCSSLRKNKIPISLSDAKAKGYEPCKKCSPQ